MRTGSATLVNDHNFVPKKTKKIAANCCCDLACVLKSSCFLTLSSKNLKRAAFSQMSPPKVLDFYLRIEYAMVVIRNGGFKIWIGGFSDRIF